MIFFLLRDNVAWILPSPSWAARPPAQKRQPCTKRLHGHRLLEATVLAAVLFEAGLLMSEASEVVYFRFQTGSVYPSETEEPRWQRSPLNWPLAER